MTWAAIRDEFRMWAFSTYYERSFATVTDHNTRFALALIHSSRPVSVAQIRMWRKAVLEGRAKRRVRGGRRQSNSEQE